MLCAMVLPSWVGAQSVKQTVSYSEIVIIVQQPKPMTSLLSAVEGIAKRRGKQEGVVNARLLVDKEGFVDEVRIPPSDDTLFDNEVKDALMRVQFIPAMTEKGPIQYWLEQEVAFDNKESSVDTSGKRK